MEAKITHRNLTMEYIPRTVIICDFQFSPPSPPTLATVYTQVGSELVSIRAEWTQTVVARELK